MSEPEDPTAPRFQWRRRDDGIWGWGFTHATAGLCSGCTRDTPETCPRCDGRLHHEPVIEDNGLVRTYFCQQERTDQNGGAARMRWAPSIADTRFAQARERARRDRRLEQVIKTIVGVKVALFVLCVAAIAIGFAYTVLS